MQKKFGIGSKPVYALSFKNGKGIQFFSDSAVEALKTEVKSALEGLKAAKEALESKHAEAPDFNEVKQRVEDQQAIIDDLNTQIKGLAAQKNRNASADGMTDEEREQKTKSSKAFYQFMRKGKRGLSADERKALVEDDKGRIIVPVELDEEIERQLPKETIFRGLVNIRKTSAEKIRKRGMNEVQTGWGKIETSAKKASDFESELEPSERFIWVQNLNGLTKIGVDELEDTDLELQTYLGASFAQAAAEDEDAAVLNGRGQNFEEPEGILTKSGIKVHTTAAIESVVDTDLIDLEYLVPAQHRRRGVYIISSKLEQNLRKLKNANGDMVWQATLGEDVPNKINGKPYYISDDFAVWGPGAVQAVFGDFKRGYTIVDRKGSTVQRLDELYIEDDLIGFKYKKRVGGGVDKPEAFALLKLKQA